MNHCSRIIFTIGLVASLLMAVYPTTDIALSATPPDVIDLPVITEEIDTPVRLAKDSSGNLYVTNPGSGGILKYNSAGSLIQKIITSKNGTGVAIAQNGDLLVTQVDRVAVIDPVLGTQKGTLGPNTVFTYANGIAVDPSGNIYVSDGKGNTVKKFNSSYAFVTSVAGYSRPAGLAYETQTGKLAVANSLAGTVLLVDPTTLSPSVGVKIIGSVALPFGYDATNALLKFTYPQGIAFEYSSIGNLERIYVADGYQSRIRVLDGQYVLTTATPITVGTGGSFLADIGGYGFVKGKIFAPSDVLYDPTDPANKRIIVANGGGNLTIFGIDRNMQPTYIQVINPQLDSLTVTWNEPAAADFSKVRVYSSNAAGQQVGLLGEVLKGTTSYLNSGLNQNTTYYYLVRAVNSGGTEYPNNQLVFGKTRLNYGLTLIASGLGSINGNEGASVGQNATTTVQILDNTLVTLTATPDATKTVFDGWSGACAAFGTNETCQVTMDAAKSVTASFIAQWPFHVDGWLLETLQDSYQTAEGSGSVIEVMTGIWPAKDFTDYTATADRPITVTIKGGYDSEFNGQMPGKTTVITGRFNVKSGKVIMNNIKIKPL